MCFRAHGHATPRYHPQSLEFSLSQNPHRPTHDSRTSMKSHEVPRSAMARISLLEIPKFIRGVGNQSHFHILVHQILPPAYSRILTRILASRQSASSIVAASASWQLASEPVSLQYLVVGGDGERGPPGPFEPLNLAVDAAAKRHSRSEAVGVKLEYCVLYCVSRALLDI